MDKLQEIKELLQHGRDTFIGYVTHHENKEHTEKAKSNKEHAYKLQLAMTIIDELIEESKWQPIESATKGKFVLLASFFEDESSVDTGIVYDNSPYYDQGFTVTHWKPLPQPPMGESND